MTRAQQVRERIYLDNSASTIVDERVLEAMQPYWRTVFGNAGSLHTEGQQAKRAVHDARSAVAEVLGSHTNQIIFTSGGTESNNMAIHGAVKKALHSGKKPNDIHVITSRIEHSSVLDCFSALERDGVRVTYIKNDEMGRMDTAELQSAITEDTLLISLVYVNNEIGTIQDVQAVKEAIQRAKKGHENIQPLLHYDASQAPVWLSLRVDKLGADLLTIDGQKIYGPKGVGCLYIRNHDSIEPMFHGGDQEFKLRPGTPPLPLIIGFTKALTLVEEERDTYVSTCRDLRDWIITQVEEYMEQVSLNGARGDERIAGNVSFSFEGIDGEQLVIELDAQGIAVSTGSACSSEKHEGSHIISALGKVGNNINGTIRLTLGRNTNREAVEYATQALIDTVSRLRAH